MEIQQKQEMGGGAATATAQTQPLFNFGSFDLAEIMKSPAKIIGIVSKLVRIVLLVLIAITALCTIIALSKVSYGSVINEFHAIGSSLVNIYSNPYSSSYGNSYSNSRYGTGTILGINSTTAICCGLLLPGCLFVTIFHIAMLIMSIRRPDLKALVIVDTVFGIISSVGFFAISVAMAVAYNQQFVTRLRILNVVGLTRSMGEAVAAFGFLTCFTTGGLIATLWINFFLAKAESDANPQ